MSTTKEQINQFLAEIETGVITLMPMTDPKKAYHSIMGYRCSNGWQLTVFVDCDYWDYIDSITTDTGEEIGFDALDAMGFSDYEPSEAVIQKTYQLPY
jgi:hypothetical protein